MFNDMTVVTTAVSSFNNAALDSPYFFISGLFSVPLFFMLFLYGRDFISKLGLSNRDIESKTGFWSVACLVLWLIIFGGNYAVIRDGISWLPIMISVVLFVSMVFVINRIKQFNYLAKVPDNKTRWFVFLLVLILAGFSAMPNLWGILLQLSAVVCGMIVGDRFNKKLSDVAVSTVVFGIMTVLLLMQPEYFRFGQLGNLTLIHLGALLLCGFFAVTTLVAKYTNARSKIYKSAYVKLKWLFRILSLLALILFVLTESVPIFIGLMIVCGISQMLTIYHGTQLPDRIYKQAWALLLTTFGVIIICPVISMLGIVYLMFMPNKIDYKDFTRLL